MPKKIRGDDKPKIKKPKKSPITKVKKEKLSPVKKKRSNITQKGKPTSSYDAQFTYDKLKERGLDPKGRMSAENYAKVKKKMGGGMMKKKSMGYAVGGSLKPVPEGSKGKGLSKLPTPVRNKMGFMRGGGKVVKMRGGGAATKGMNFNRGY